MFEVPFSKKEAIISIFISLVVLIILFLKYSSNSDSKVVFCDVGQGDGTYIRIKNQIDILVDAGPNRKILDCLGRHMPFYDRSIELAIISHAQKDHFGGFLYLLDRYDIKKFWLSEASNDNRSFRELLDQLDSKQIIMEFPKTGETSAFSGAQIEFFWPSEDFILKNTHDDYSEPTLLRQTDIDLNDFSLIFTLEIDGSKILFTGDASQNILSRLLKQSKIKSKILKTPHHGSKNGLNTDFLKLADPDYGVISNGLNNSYGHPHKVVLDMFAAQNVIIRRTDKEGDIIFSFD